MIEAIDATNAQPTEQRETVNLDDIATAEVTAKTVADFVERAKHTEALRRAVIAATDESQWHDFGGKPYMEGDAALTIAKVMGISFEEPHYEFRDLGGGAAQCVCTVRVHHAGRTFQDIGDCDSFDDFLEKRRMDLERRGATPDQISAALRVELQKKARANANSRAVSGIAGLRGLSWDALEMLGLRRAKVGATQFRRGTAAAAQGRSVSGSLAELAAAPIGSVMTVTGVVEKVEERKSRDGSKTWYDVHVAGEAGGKSLRIQTWSADAAKLQPGDFVECAETTVKDYQGKPQYNAKAVVAKMDSGSDFVGDAY